jgi:hypothetical protein
VRPARATVARATPNRRRLRLDGGAERDGRAPAGPGLLHSFPSCLPAAVEARSECEGAWWSHTFAAPPRVWKARGAPMEASHLQPLCISPFGRAPTEAAHVALPNRP